MVLLTVLSLTAALGFDFDVIDFTQAYSQAGMIDIVYAIPHDDFEDFRDPEKPKDDILQVLKALYGSPQAGRRWHDKVARKLRNLGYTQSTIDACLFFLQCKDKNCPPIFTKDPSSLPWILLVRTDDVLTFYKHHSQTPTFALVRRNTGPADAPLRENHGKQSRAPAHRTFTDQITVPLEAHMAENEDAPARLFRSDSISPSLSRARFKITIANFFDQRPSLFNLLMTVATPSPTHRNDIFYIQNLLSSVEVMLSGTIFPTSRSSASQSS
eukprot:g76918.t1